jgi:hypothetical protein
VSQILISSRSVVLMRNKMRSWIGSCNSDNWCMFILCVVSNRTHVVIS